MAPNPTKIASLDWSKNKYFFSYKMIKISNLPSHLTISIMDLTCFSDLGLKPGI
jgi:hypothetical protein